ncbi:hypothetical protein [Frankia sp. BMG5.23]|uniref:hypothetical protein n=1 Tax=Frankia sp. BMG5.23 TaxID=683305 RepID=UPI000461AE7C|nr:hypothetical protein [Frankia sp. BMG5.23]KDA40948.1 hypothetical protein BMG523Draft_04227 [Frankia sp. BMG5.23]
MDPQRRQGGGDGRLVGWVPVGVGRGGENAAGKGDMDGEEMLGICEAGAAGGADGVGERVRADDRDVGDEDEENSPGA